jgi:hypothetical protein
MSFICFRIVDFPDSPAPVQACQMRWRTNPKTSRPTQKQHFDLVALLHAIPLQLVLNLLVPGLALLILRAHSATHLGDLSQRRTMAESVWLKGRNVLENGSYKRVGCVSQTAGWQGSRRCPRNRVATKTTRDIIKPLTKKFGVAPILRVGVDTKATAITLRVEFG